MQNCDSLRCDIYRNFLHAWNRLQQLLDQWDLVRATDAHDVHGCLSQSRGLGRVWYGYCCDLITNCPCLQVNYLINYRLP